MKLSVVIPAHNEEGCIEGTVRALEAELRAQGIAHEILVVNDGSTDGTEAILRRLQAELPALRWVNNAPPNGFGLAVRRGLDAFTGDAVAEFRRLAEEARARVLRGEASPLEFHMYDRRMDLPTLAQTTGLWRWRIRRHLRPAVFARLPERLLLRYADALGISLEQLKAVH